MSPASKHLADKRTTVLWLSWCLGLIVICQECSDSCHGEWESSSERPRGPTTGPSLFAKRLHWTATQNLEFEKVIRCRWPESTGIWPAVLPWHLRGFRDTLHYLSGILKAATAARLPEKSSIIHTITFGYSKTEPVYTLSSLMKGVSRDSKTSKQMAPKPTTSLIHGMPKIPVLLRSPRSREEYVSSLSWSLREWQLLHSGLHIVQRMNAGLVPWHGHEYSGFLNGAPSFLHTSTTLFDSSSWLTSVDMYVHRGEDRLVADFHYSLLP